MRIRTNRLKLDLLSFRCKAYLYFRYLRVKFEDEIERNPFECQASFVISLRQTLN